jgi:hypothetical protein
MGTHAKSDGVLGGGRPFLLDVGARLNAYVACGESALCLGRDLAATALESFRRRVSAHTGFRVHVSAMSASWLQMHETDDGKHHAER